MEWSVKHWIPKVYVILLKSKQVKLNLTQNTRQKGILFICLSIKVTLEATLLLMVADSSSSEPEKLFGFAGDIAVEPETCIYFLTHITTFYLLSFYFCLL